MPRRDRDISNIAVHFPFYSDVFFKGSGTSCQQFVIQHKLVALLSMANLEINYWWNV